MTATQKHLTTYGHCHKAPLRCSFLLTLCRRCKNR